MNKKQPDIELEDIALSRHERFENWLLKRYKTINAVTLGVGIAAGSFFTYHFGNAAYLAFTEGDPRASVSENPAFKKEEFYKSMDYSQIGFYLMCGSLFPSFLIYYEGKKIAREREEESKKNYTY